MRDRYSLKEPEDESLTTRLGNYFDAIEAKRLGVAQSLDGNTHELPQGRAISLEFTANVGAYFRLWGVCQLLTVLTLGIYGPWARTRRAQFLGKHWRLDGQSFDVQFQPTALLRGRLLVFALLALGIGLQWWNPWLAPPMVLLAFLAAPWLLANSFAFRWRTLSHRGIRFDSAQDVAPLSRPFVLLGLASALAILPIGWWLLYVGKAWAGLVVPVFILPAAYFWPRATSALTHYRFSKASWGRQQFALAATALEIYKHMWRSAFSLSTLVLVVFFGVLTLISVVYASRDTQAILLALGYLLITIFAVTFSRSRRLNFVLHRLEIGGLRFRSTMDPDSASFLTASYALLAACTLGLSIPWSTVHFSRWRASRVVPYLEGDWTQFVGSDSYAAASGALDEMGNAFDIEIGI